MTELLVTIAETAAPTFHEERRAELIWRLWQEAGHTPKRDSAGNVLCEIAGGTGPRVVLAAHLDSVFGPEVAVSVHREPGRLRGPGVGDNAASLAVITRLLQDLSVAPVRPRLLVAATVGEEGVGDLKGARRLVEDLGECDHFVAVDGHLGVMTHRAVGSVRYETVFTGPGGHSWGDYPGPSAVHAAGAAVARLAAIDVPSDPRSSLNVGQLWGGTSINAIAERAGFNLDLRSVDPEALARLVTAAKAAVGKAAKESGCPFEMQLIGERPAATVDNEVLVSAARRALARVGLGLKLSTGSTDANIAMAQGMSAAAFGVYRGGDAHRLEEWVDPDSLPLGLRALSLLLEELATGPD
ncbi:MAG TPA: M20/M25/M40 family metallo-hydrolase [Trueperaceae bacterium]|nr:M20/M25/M40 family metallo-hydrolase [Trueperaceae bacterium]